MRLTLEELKGMSEKDLGQKWYVGEFPFDAMKGCGGCLASHSIHTCSVHGRISTPPFEPDSGAEEGIGAFLRLHLEEYWAARLLYDSLYPQTEAAPSMPEAVAEGCHGPVPLKSDSLRLPDLTGVQEINLCSLVRSLPGRKPCT
jgi:hypothetical protein